MNRLTNLFSNFLRGLGELSPDCHEATRLQSDALDHALPFRRRLGLRVHLLLCKWCRRYGQQINFLCHAAHDHADELVKRVPQKLSPQARARIQQKIHEHRK